MYILYHLYLALFPHFNTFDRSHRRKSQREVTQMTEVPMMPLQMTGTPMARTQIEETVSAISFTESETSMAMARSYQKYIPCYTSREILGAQS